MFRSVRSPALDVSGALRALPTSHVTYFHDQSWLVMGPTGLFLITVGEGDVEAAAAAALGAARRLRAALAAEVAWVPFVDAVVVVASLRRPQPSVPALVVAIDRLASTIADGPRIVDDETLARLTRMRMSWIPTAAGDTLSSN